MDDSTGIVAHVTSADPGDWAAALRNVGNLLDSEAGGAADVAVVVHGGALPLLVEGSGVDDHVGELAGRGVSFRACANTLWGRPETEADLVDGVIIVDSGVGEVVRLQRDGWAYLKLP